MHSSLLQLFVLNTSTVRLLRHGCFLNPYVGICGSSAHGTGTALAATRRSYPGSNTAEEIALSSLTTGENKTALGFKALFANTTGFNNPATGERALRSNTTGSNNAANGTESLTQNTADNNTAHGFQALFSNTIGTLNTANGLAAVFSNTAGNENTANGSYALYSNTTGADNTATGVSHARKGARTGSAEMPKRLSRAK